MDTKTFVNQLSQITEALLAMTPAQRDRSKHIIDGMLSADMAIRNTVTFEALA